MTAPLIRSDWPESRGNSRASASDLYWWLIAGSVVGGTLSRLILFVLASPRYDEAYTHLNFATTNMWDALSLYETPNNHILYSVVARVAHVVGGDTILATRSPALLAGVLLIPATIYFARLVTRSRRIAVATGILVAFHPQLIHYSANARGYTMIALFAVIWGILGYHIARQDIGRLASWLALSIVSALGIWTIPVFVYALPGLVIWVLIVRRHLGGIGWEFTRRAVGAALVAVALTAAAFYPAISRMTLDGILSNPLLNPTSPSLGGVPGRALASWFQRLPIYISDILDWVTFALPPAAAVVLAVLALMGIFGRKSPFAIRILVPLLIPPALMLMAVQRLQPLARSWITVLPFLLVTVAAGAVSLLGERKIRVAQAVAAATAIVVMTIVMGVQALEIGSRLREIETTPDMEAVVMSVGQEFPEGARLVIHPSDVPQFRYWRTQYPHMRIGGEVLVVVHNLRRPASLEEMAEMGGVTASELEVFAQLRSTTLYRATDE